MLRLLYSNRSEALLQQLVRAVDREREERGPLEPIHLIVPNRNMERYVELGIAEARGVAANLQFHRLEPFVSQWVGDALPDVRILDRAQLETRLLDLLLDEERLADPVFQPVREYLLGAGADPEAVDLRRVQLALKLASLFEAYSFSRPDLLDAWRRGHPVPERDAPSADHLLATADWQRALFMAFADGEATDGRRWATLHEALRALDRANDSPAPAPSAHVFGVSYVARVFHWAFSSLASLMEVHLYTLNPCMEFWEDVPSTFELRSRRRSAGLVSRSQRRGVELDSLELHPHVAAADGDTPPLVLWGRPGREHIHVLNDLTECDFEAAFVDPREASESMLARLQSDVLHRVQGSASSAAGAAEAKAARSAAPGPGGTPRPSVSVLRAPGVRREVEAVADEIWRLVRADRTSPLRFNDIAVLVTGSDRETYLPHIDAVFDEAGRIPHSIVDLPLPAGSRIAEAALRLIELPFSRLSRAEVLDVATHPAIRGRVADADPAEWTRLSARLGVFHGLDQSELRHTYIDRDAVNWDQAVRRLALGAFMTSEQSGDERAFELSGERYLAEESDSTAVGLGLLVRSLTEDVRFARGRTRPLSEWAAFLLDLLGGYLAPATATEEADLRRCLVAVQGLADRELTSGPVGYRVAAELARRALTELTTGRGDYLADGVVVSTLVPMRTIPFRAVFVLGLGEGRFPTTERRDTMDLRAVRRRPGDVSPAERDEYTFLETLLSAREHVVLSYVGRDAVTGDPLAPSPVVRQLLDVIKAGYEPDADRTRVRDVPFRRFDAREEDDNAERPRGDDGDPSETMLTEARAEARARALGRAIRAQTPFGTLRTGPDGNPSSSRRALEAATGPAWPAVRRLLRYPPLPDSTTSPVTLSEDSTGNAGSDATRRITLSLSSLRRFVEDPMQGWAKAVLRVEEDRGEAPEAQEDEPFEPSRLDLTVALREAFLDAIRAGKDLETSYRELAERLQAHGQWPLGLLADLRAEADRDCLESWRAGYERIAAQAGPKRLRFGPGLEHGDADVLLSSIELELPQDPRPGAEAGSVTLEITGQTQPLLEAPAGTLLLVTKVSGNSASERRVSRRRHLLRAFFDHLALAASEQRTGPRDAFILDGAAGERSHPHPSFLAIDPSEARAYLASLARDMLGSAHAYQLPSETIFSLGDDWPALTPAALAKALANLRSPGGEGVGAARFGPVRNAGSFPVPAADEAYEMARRRFDLFFASLREPAE